MTVADETLVDWVRLVRSEFEEMPGLVLTCPQIRRMWGIDCDACSQVMAHLLADGFVVRRPDGTYARPSDMHAHR